MASLGHNELGYKAIIWTNAGICHLDPKYYFLMKFHLNILSPNCIWKFCLQNGYYIVSASVC